MFSDIFTFMDKGIAPCRTEVPAKPLAMDFLALPRVLIQNVGNLPKFFKQINPESYFGADQDLHIQVAASLSILMQRSITNPHMRAELINFHLYITPQKNVP